MAATAKATKGNTNNTATKGSNAPAVTAPVTAAPVANTAAAAVPMLPAMPNTGKYTGTIAKLGMGVGNHTPGWQYASKTLGLGQYAPAKATSVMGLIYGLVKANPGITGAQLIAAMQQNGQAFAATAAVKYASNGMLCGMWCQGYINGALRKTHGHLAVVG
jgi:hypothetical protein